MENKKEPTIDTEQLANECVAICEERKAENVILFDVREKSILADFFLVCSGTSQPHISALSTHIRKTMMAHGISPKGQDGQAESKWIVLDYGDILIHILDPETRKFYCLEELWDDRKIVYQQKADDEKQEPVDNGN
ncbi:MAG: ribosome silencing factor [Lentisphaeria bacterium]